MQSESNRAPTPVERGVAVVALLAGAVLLVSVILKMSQGVASDAGPWTRAIARLIDVLGELPVLVLAVGLSGIGGVAVARREPTPLARSMVGLLGVVFGLSLVLGAITNGHGGEFGGFFQRALGGLAAGIAGFATGVMLVLAATWVAFRAPSAGHAENSVHSGGDLDALTRRPDDDGVTTAEATALGHRAVVQPIASSTAEEVSALRSRGGIPAGTRPLSTDDVRPEAPSPIARASAPGGVAEVDAAGAQPVGAHVVGWARVGSGARAEAELESTAERTAEPARDALRARAAQFEARVADAHRAVEPLAVEPLVEPARPRWESITEAGELEPETRVEERGPTPAKWEQDALLSPVEPVSAAAESADADAETEARAETERGFDWTGDVGPTAGAGTDALAPSVGDVASASASAPQPAPPAVEPEEVLALQTSATFEPVAAVEADEPVEVAESAKPAPVQQPTLFELEEPELDPMPEREQARESEAAPREAPPASAAPEREPAASEPAAAELPERELVPAPRVVAQELRVVTDPEPIVEIVAEEPTIEVEPETTAAAADDADAALGGHGAQLRQCGLLFIDRQRVAVSMLQREFGMDFKQATEMLDELQQLGLIGPYMGGTRRDILMDRESWLAAVARI
ncbi:MAG: hypothetical protein EPO68_07110 [Planctomycetota bacterium]|nr:MAG: hypothetical protein EPO68_07110 [Planctomycetota bacterium]